MSSKKGGNKQKSKANKSKRAGQSVKALVIRQGQKKSEDPIEVYGQVESELGNRNMLVRCHDKVKRICHIRGSMRKNERINKDDFVLVSVRSFQDTKGDILHLYASENIKALRSNQTEGPLIEELILGSANASKDGVKVEFSDRGRGKNNEMTDADFEDI